VANVASTPKPPAGSSLVVPAGFSANDPSNTGPNSLNQSTNTTNNNGFFNGFYNVSISNDINSSAHSGNASVLQNTNGGNALTGDAQTIANVLNMLQSSWNPNGGNILTFTGDINGNVSGDLVLDPSLINTTGPNSVNSTDNTTNNNLTVNVQANGTINNNLTLDAGSGNATVSGNTNAGDATTGNATAIANVVNMINSAIHAGQSFVGTLNINGDLNGDILLPQWLLSGLLQNTGPNSTNTSNNTVNNNLTADLSNNTAINNNINATATSGKADVSGNTTAGNATTGDASTNVTLLNLTGKQVVGKDALLVFVNVFGKWVGMILNAPIGSTSAVIGNTGPDSTNTSNNTVNNNADITASANNTINNNIDATATSGDATVSNNTKAGDATTGDAHVGVNVANIVNSDVNLSDWFGILFINVFGNWMGSFGVNTAAGNPATPSATAQTNASSGSSNDTTVPQVFRFVPKTTTNQNDGNSQQNGAVLASNTDNANPSSPSTASEPHTQLAASSASHANFWWALIGIFTAMSLLGVERFLTFRTRI
ncbi:MAG TPA: hypothetical protein VLF87_03555, partial [Patescibacteria group bacterium]|nr:hypothetical protein [Patescibacteria group bacterium]